MTIMIQWTDPINGAELVASIIVSIGLALAASYLGARRALRKQRVIDKRAAEALRKQETEQGIPKLIDAIVHASMPYWFYAPEPMPSGQRLADVKRYPRVSEAITVFMEGHPHFDPTVAAWFRHVVRPLDAIRDAALPIRGSDIHDTAGRVEAELNRAKSEAVGPYSVRLQWFHDEMDRVNRES
ncbi:hypothetical protein [Plantibacter sp. ME-Dv--P-095]|uniref:hypothetical protein n=1 Tax=Plantibacter sp. ME-Dv--P-095 TaxID=3040299 RepID=UPI0025508986|nr:hypothetical protein [Plantibacter sp. ME-Dv--P-095]